MISIHEIDQYFISSIMFLTTIIAYILPFLSRKKDVVVNLQKTKYHGLFKTYKATILSLFLISIFLSLFIRESAISILILFVQIAIIIIFHLFIAFSINQADTSKPNISIHDMNIYASVKKPIRNSWFLYVIGLLIFGINLYITVKKDNNIFKYPLMSLVFLLSFALINSIIWFSKNNSTSTINDGEINRDILFRKYWSYYLSFTGAIAYNIYFLFLNLAEIGLKPVPNSFIAVFTYGFPVLFLSFSIILIMYTGQSGGNLVPMQRPNFSSIFDGAEYWKWGIFYFNRNDPSLFVEKRSGLGWTINTANPLSYFVIIGFLFALILVAVLIPG
jgi:hypothetical protein